MADDNRNINFHMYDIVCPKVWPCLYVSCSLLVQWKMDASPLNHDAELNNNAGIFHSKTDDKWIIMCKNMIFQHFIHCIYWSCWRRAVGQMDEKKRANWILPCWVATINRQFSKPKCEKFTQFCSQMGQLGNVWIHSDLVLIFAPKIRQF